MRLTAALSFCQGMDLSQSLGVEVFVVDPGVADGEDEAFADGGFGDDDVLGGAGAVVGFDGFFVVFVDDEDGLCGGFDGDGGDFFHVGGVEAFEERMVGEAVASSEEGGVGAVGGFGGGVAGVGVEGDAEAGGELVEVGELTFAGVVGEEDEDAAVVDPGFDGGDGGLSM